MKQPTKEEIQAELQSIKAAHSQLKKQIVDLGRRTSICQRKILDLQPQARIAAKVITR